MFRLSQDSSVWLRLTSREHIIELYTIYIYIERERDVDIYIVKTITIQYRYIQGALTDFQKYRFCKDSTNLFWTQIFLLEFPETNFAEFQTSLLPKLASFCDLLQQSCLYLAVYEMLTYYLDM